jgi:pantoate--beta-alanine ligase
MLVNHCERPGMEIARDVDAVRHAVAALRAEGRGIGLVPTMGALHAGHMALVGSARAQGLTPVASIFINPRQFAPGEDYARYPRQETADVALLRAAGCALLFAPTVDAIYPPGFATSISPGPIGMPWDGSHRPGHFDGVATIVAKLLIVFAPDAAFFGEKDWQQLAVIRRIRDDLGLAPAIIGVPTVRDPDGLALSSRNAYLDAGERISAAALPRALQHARSAIERGEPVDAMLAAAGDTLLRAGFSRVDYCALVDPATLEPLDRADRPGRLLAAAHLGRARLIDNIAVGPAE